MHCGTGSRFVVDENKLTVIDPGIESSNTDRPMAVRLVTKRQRLVAYWPSIRAAVQHVRAFSSDSDSWLKQESDMEAITGVQPHSALNALFPHKQFLLPGNVGVTNDPISKFRNRRAMDRRLEKAKLEIAKYKQGPPYFTPNRSLSLDELLGDAFEKEMEVEEFSEAEEDFTESEPYDCLELSPHYCPLEKRKDFKDLFPNRDIMKGNFTVITISRKTDTDMSVWTPDLEMERDCLLEEFVLGAKEMCKELNDAGYWADFIDPSSGRPFFGEYTNATMFETNENYTQFGFAIDDLGCCKVLRHPLWGTYCYVGCLFTDAPLDSLIMQRLTERD